VRFDAPPTGEVAERLGRHGVAPPLADACARLGLGDAEHALRLALGDGPALRAGAERFARAPLHSELAGQPWSGMLEQARKDGAAALDAVEERVAESLDLLPQKERRKAEREGTEAGKRAQRRARTTALDQSLQLAGLWYRDCAAVLDGAPELVHHADRAAEVAADAERVGDADRLREAVVLVDEARAAFVLNPTEDLLLEALASRLERVLAH
jgi:DNA polymerase-3 subunit delta'